MTILLTGHQILIKSLWKENNDSFIADRRFTMSGASNIFPVVQV